MGKPGLAAGLPAAFGTDNACRPSWSNERPAGMQRPGWRAPSGSSGRLSGAASRRIH